MSGIDLPVQIRTAQLIKPKANILYPIIDELPNPQAQQNINNTVIHTVYQMLHQQGYPQNPLAESTGYYEIKTNERDVLSLSLFNYTFAGGAHGLTIQKSLTFDVKTGELCPLHELFIPGSNYIQRLNEFIHIQIKARDIPLLVEFKGIQPNQDFYIADKALVIYYQVYELTAYVYGFTYFPISIFEIQSMVDEQGPLGQMIY